MREEVADEVHFADENQRYSNTTKISHHNTAGKTCNYCLVYAYVYAQFVHCMYLILKFIMKAVINLSMLCTASLNPINGICQI